MTATQLYSHIIKMPTDMRKKVWAYIESLYAQSSTKIPKPKDRIPGLAKGLIIIKDNFDDPIEDFKDYM